MPNDLNTGQMHKPGDILLKRFRVEEILGKGAFAEVYRVMHLHMNVPRAIKVLRKDTRGVGSEDYRKIRERFKLEAQLGSSLDHQNVIKVYDCEEKAGELFLIMECADRRSLKYRLDRGERLSVEVAVRLGVDICNGLMALHEKLEAIHRDIKPSNILFAEDGTAKIGDLGLAQVSGSDSLRSELGTFSPGHPGTPEYMSPEQESTKGYLLPTSDIFSLGCVLFEALTGKHYKKVYGTRVRDHRSDIPVWLEDIVARALVEAPGRVPDDDRVTTKRYRQADIMRRALEHGWQAEKEKQKEAQRIAQEQAQEARQRTAEINRLQGEIQSALSRKDWIRVERLVNELAGLGVDGKREAAKLHDQVFNMRKQAEEQREEEKAKRDEAWRKAEQAQREAEELARREAEKRAAEITRLKKKVQAALGQEDWKQAEQVVGELENLGADGKLAAVKLGKRIAQAKQAVEIRLALTIRWQASLEKWRKLLKSKALWILVVLVISFIGVVLLVRGAVDEISKILADRSATQTAAALTAGPGVLPGATLISTPTTLLTQVNTPGLFRTASPTFQPTRTPLAPTATRTFTATSTRIPLPTNTPKPFPTDTPQPPPTNPPEPPADTPQPPPVATTEPTLPIRPATPAPP